MFCNARDLLAATNLAAVNDLRLWPHSRRPWPITLPLYTRVSFPTTANGIAVDFAGEKQNLAAFRAAKSIRSVANLEHQTVGLLALRAAGGSTARCRRSSLEVTAPGEITPPGVRISAKPSKVLIECDAHGERLSDGHRIRVYRRIPGVADDGTLVHQVLDE